MKKILSFMLCLAMLASLVVTSSSVAFAAEETGVKAYVADRTGIVSSYEGNYSGHNESSTAYKWGNYSNNWESTVSNDPNTGLETVVFAGENSKADSASVVLQNAFSADNVKKVVMTVRADSEAESLPWNMYYLNTTTIGASWGAQNGTDNGVLSFDGDNKFKEYEFSTATGFNSWTGNKQALRMTMKASSFPVKLDIAYIRFVDDTYGKEIKIANGSGGNNHLNDIMRFEFSKELDRETVKAENILLNGVPATYIIENNADDSLNSLRVRLGTLAEASRYTVTFDGVKYADGTAVEEVFKFATENESIPVYPESLKAYSTDRTGIVAAWEGTRVNDYTWSNANWTTAVCEYNGEAGAAKVQFPSSSNPHAFFKLANPITGTENITKMVVGIKTNQDADLKLYYVTGTQLKGFAETQVAKYISVKKGDGGYEEYSVPISSFEGFADDMQSFRLSVSGADESPAVDYNAGLNLDIAYIRFVTDKYQARKAEIQNFAKDYSDFTDSVRFLFTKDLDASTVNAENIKINGTKNPVDVFNVKDNTVCVRFGNIPSVSRCRVTFPDMKYADGTDVDEQFVFTTTGTGLLGALEFTNDTETIKADSSITVSHNAGNGTAVIDTSADAGYIHIYFDNPIPAENVKYIDIKMTETNNNTEYTKSYYDLNYYFLLNGKSTASAKDPIKYGSHRVSFDKASEFRFDVDSINTNAEAWCANENDTLTGMRIDVGTLKTIEIDYIRVVSDYYDDKKNDTFLNNEIPAATYELVSGFETENEAAISGPLPSGEITAVTGGLCGVADEKKEYSMYLALYDNGTLISVACKQIVLGPGMEVGQQTLKVTVPQKQEGDSDDRYSVKAFLWGTDEMIPCIHAVTPSNNRI